MINILPRPPNRHCSAALRLAAALLALLTAADPIAVAAKSSGLPKAIKLPRR